MVAPKKWKKTPSNSNIGDIEWSRCLFSCMATITTTPTKMTATAIRRRMNMKVVRSVTPNEKKRKQKKNLFDLAFKVKIVSNGCFENDHQLTNQPANQPASHPSRHDHYHHDGYEVWKLYIDDDGSNGGLNNSVYMNEFIYRINACMRTRFIFVSVSITLLTPNRFIWILR